MFRRLISSLILVVVAAVMISFALPFLEPQWETLRAGQWREAMLLILAAVMVVIFLPWILIGIWRKPAEDTQAIPELEPEAQTTRRQRGDDKASWGCLIGPAVFLLAGLGFAVIFVIPAIKSLQALGWDESSCQILASSVATHSGEDGPTYSVEVTYRYEVDGVEYTSDRYRFMGGSSSGYKGKRKVVDRLAPGTTTTCWVNPKDPGDAVIKRGLSWEFAFVILPLVFIVIGAVGVVMALKARSKEKRMQDAVASGMRDVFRAEAAEANDVLPEVEPGELLLEPQATPLTKLLVIVGVALFWNGIVGVFVWQLIQEPDVFLGCFLIPFILIGLALLTGIPYQLLALANPRPHLRLADGRLRPGGSTTLYWTFSGAARRLQNLKIHLEGREIATYKSGDSSSTTTQMFARVDLVDFDRSGHFAEGNVAVEVPRGAMHTFKGSRSKIVWFLVLRGSIARWPDVGEEFEVTVLPEVAR